MEHALLTTNSFFVVIFNHSFELFFILSNSQPGKLSLFILLLLAIPLSHGTSYKGIRPKSTGGDSLFRFITENPRNSDGAEDNSTLTEVGVQIKRNCTYTCKDVCQRLMTQALQYITDPDNKKKTCKIIPKCRCTPLGCAKCKYRKN